MSNPTAANSSTPVTNPRGASATGFGTCTKPGRHKALGARRIRRRSRSTPIELPELRLQVGLQASAVLALEGAQLVDLLLQDSLLLADRAEDLGVLASRVTLQRRSLLPGLPVQRLRSGTSVIEHGLGPGPGLVDHAVGLSPGVREQLLGLGPGFAQHPVRFGLGLAG